MECRAQDEKNGHVKSMIAVGMELTGKRQWKIIIAIDQLNTQIL